MTTTSFTVPRLRHLSWYALLLLPVIPYLGRLHADEGLFFGEISAFSPALLVVGVVLALGIPALLDSLGPVARKEAEQLRPAWLASVLVVQVGLVLGRDLDGLEVMLFAATSALLAATTFGLEFQQRTLSGLLSQPVERADWWQIKTRTLAAALGLHWVLFQLAGQATRGEATWQWVLGSFVAVILAYGTTPWWTLVTRGMLAGLVFSLTVPLLALTVLAAASGAWGAADLVRLGQPRADEVWFYGLLFVGAPAYAVVGGLMGYRRWAQLEAPDTVAAEGGILGWPRLRLGWDGTAGAGMAATMWRLASKELRLQTATMAMIGVAMVMALWVVTGKQGDLSEAYSRGGFILVSAAAILLAGGVTLAEERRLGTLDPQLLSPMSRRSQWWLKIGIAAFLSALVSILVVVVAGAIDRQAADLDEVGRITLVAFILFAAACLASSGSNNAVRAVILAVTLVAAVGGILAVLHRLETVAGQVSQGLYADFTLSDLDRWKAEVAAVSPAQAEAIQARADGALAGWLRTVMLAVRYSPLLAGVLALYFAWANFAQPADAERRLGSQARRCLALLLFLGLVWVAVLAAWTWSRSKAAVLSGAYQMLSIERKLTPAERLLWERYRTSPLYHGLTIRTSEGGDGVVANYQTTVPLSPQGRRSLLRFPGLEPGVREALAEEARARGEEVPEVDPLRETTPQAPPAGTFQMSPELMKRYGLTPATPMTIPAPAPSSGSGTAPVTPASPSSRVYPMSRELMKRYGLMPQEASNPPAVLPAPPTTAPRP